MRILVVSDSHGGLSNLRKVIEMHKEANLIIFLGDGEEDFDDIGYLLTGRNVIKVCGNCDSFSSLNEFEIVKRMEHTIFCTHGHRESVKYGMEKVLFKASCMGADILLYGHTHRQEAYTDESGIHVMNPGSIYEGYYGMIDIEKSGVLLIPAKL